MGVTRMSAPTRLASISLLSEQLAAQRLHVAETYISKAGLREFRKEVMTGVRDLKGSVSTLHERAWTASSKATRWCESVHRDYSQVGNAILVGT